MERKFKKDCYKITENGLKRLTQNVARERSFYLGLEGRQRLTLEKYQKILSCTTEQIRIRTKQSVITVSGKNLWIPVMCLSYLVIEGSIQGVFLEGNEE